MKDLVIDFVCQHRIVVTTEVYDLQKCSRHTVLSVVGNFSFHGIGAQLKTKM